MRVKIRYGSTSMYRDKVMVYIKGEIDEGQSVCFVIPVNWIPAPSLDTDDDYYLGVYNQG